MQDDILHYPVLLIQLPLKLGPIGCRKGLSTHLARKHSCHLRHVRRVYLHAERGGELVRDRLAGVYRLGEEFLSLRGHHFPQAHHA